MREKRYADSPQTLPTRRDVITGGAISLGSLLLGSQSIFALVGDEISRTGAAIHLEPVFNANRKRVYEVLTDATQFAKVVDLSGALKKMHLGTTRAEIGREPGGAFSLFGGYITGFTIEAKANERLVQAWRSGSWAEGSFSIARFELLEQGATTKIMFDHTGFPSAEAETLLEGWKANYFEPMTKLLN